MRQLDGADDNMSVAESVTSSLGAHRRRRRCRRKSSVTQTAVPLAEETTKPAEADVPSVDDRAELALVAPMAVASVPIVLTAEENECVNYATRETRRVPKQGDLFDEKNALQKAVMNNLPSGTVDTVDGPFDEKNAEAVIDAPLVATLDAVDGLFDKKSALQEAVMDDPLLVTLDTVDGPFDDNNSLQEAATDPGGQGGYC